MMVLHKHLKPAIEEMRKEIKSMNHGREQIAMEWGFKACEKGWNLERSLLEFAKVQTGKETE